MKHKYIFISILCGILLTGLVYMLVSFFLEEKKETEVTKFFSSVDLSHASSITCTYPQTLYAKYYEEKISHMVPKPETNPLIFTFSNLTDSQTGKLSYIDSTQTITNVDLIKIIDNEEKIMYVEGNAANYLTVHTLYKKLGVSAYMKSVSLLGIPVTSSAIGTCAGY